MPLIRLSRCGNRRTDTGRLERAITPDGVYLRIPVDHDLPHDTDHWSSRRSMRPHDPAQPPRNARHSTM
jgi:hypothetical protein